MVNENPYQTVDEDDYQIIVYQNTTFVLTSGNIDVEVVLKDGRRYTATVFTLDNIQALMNKYAESGECHNGTYFWASDMIIVKELTIVAIRETVKSMFENNELQIAFAESTP